MSELVYLKNNAAVCDSLQVAEKFGRNHKYVLKKIEKLLEDDSANKLAQCIRISKYKDASGKYNKMYLLNKDGFVFLAFGFTGKEADAWKWKYIEAFNQMEKLIQEKSTAAYQLSDQAEKATRKTRVFAIAY